MKPLYALIALSLILGGGCVAQPKLIGAQANATADAITSDLSDAQTHLSAARPHADAVGQPHIDAAAKSVASAAGRVAPLHQQIDMLTALATKYQTLWDTSWFGGLTHSLWDKFVIFSLAAIVIFFAVQIATQGGAGFLVKAARTAVGILVSVIPFAGGYLIKKAKDIEHSAAIEKLKAELSPAPVVMPPLPGTYASPISFIPPAP